MFAAERAVVTCVGDFIVVVIGVADVAELVLVGVLLARVRGVGTVVDAVLYAIVISICHGGGDGDVDHCQVAGVIPTLGSMMK